MTRARRHSPGQALAEFSIAFTVFVFIVFGLIDFGRLVYAHNSLAEAAREGARYGSVQARAGTDIPGIEAYTVGHVTGLPGVTATAECIRPGTIIQPCKQHDTLEVTVEASVEMLTPFIAQLMGGLGLNPIDLSSTSQVLVNN